MDSLNSDNAVVSPGHFAGNVYLFWRFGNAASTAYADFASSFPSIWTADHRGDGLASIAMIVNSVANEDIQKTFPQGMPLPTAIIEGNDQLIDPRNMMADYSTNIAVFRFWHLTHPVGGKLSIDDMHLPDWQTAANVSDQFVTDRNGASVRRYHGGYWFKAENDPVAIGRTFDQAAELMLYETPEGKVGVHAGQYVEPTLRLSSNAIIQCLYDPNRDPATTVRAVRGRYTDLDKGFTTADAAIYGVPYPTDDERTKTVENACVQHHNHMARLQKLAYVRANAPRVSIIAHYEAAEDVPYRRFVRIHHPPKLVEAVVEIIGRPTLSLRNLTMEFEGIVVPSTLYAFNAASEEGAPGASVVPVARQDVPEPESFAVTIKRETLSGGQTAAYAEATYTLQNATFQYELEWQPTSGGAVSQVLGNAGDLLVRSAYLADGVQYRFRSRTWSAGTPSGWTDYQVLTATADTTPPGVVTGVAVTPGAGEATFDWTAPNSPNYVGARIYTNTANSFGTATLQAVEYGAPSSVDSRTIPLTAGAKFGWIVAINASGVAASPVDTGTFTVTP